MAMEIIKILLIVILFLIALSLLMGLIYSYSMLKEFLQDLKSNKKGGNWYDRNIWIFINNVSNNDFIRT